MPDILIRHATIVDGTGNRPCRGNVAVRDGIIERVGSLGDLNAETVIEADGRYLTPGFIDTHRHADLQVFSPGFGGAELCQGITTFISGNCGMSAAPCPKGQEEMLYGYLEPCLGKPAEKAGFSSFAEYVNRAGKIPVPLNFGNYVGSGTVRIAVKGFDPSPMTAAQMDTVKGYVEEAMESGAFGLSMGIMYSPECFYSKQEMAKIARVAGRYGGILATHIRGEGDSMPESVAEVIDIARHAEIPLNISHLKAAGRNNWGCALKRAFELIEKARSAGQDITCDVYPYDAGSTMLFTLIPPEFLAGGVGQALENLKSVSFRDKLRFALSGRPEGWDNLVLSLGWESVIISSANREENRGFIGLSVAEIAKKMGCDEIDAVSNLLISEEGRVGIVIFSMSPEDVREVITRPYSMIISDSIYPASGNPHPRLFGAFPRVLRKLVREEGLLTIEKAVQKMSSMPARRLKLDGRGEIREGFRADMLLFDLSKVADTATYENPAQFARGMDYSFIGGNIALKDGKPVDGRFGSFLRRQ